MKDISLEEWKDIKDWEGFYMISNLGRVLSVGRKVTQGKRKVTVKTKVLSPIINKKTDNYSEEVVYLASKDKGFRRKKYRVSRLVADAFIPKKKDKEQVNHIDCNPCNNNVSNLEWTNQKENMEHASKLKRMKGRIKK